jgi:hypothetical protein
MSEQTFDYDDLRRDNSRDRRDERDDIPGYGMFDLDNRQRDNDYEGQQSVGYSNVNPYYVLKFRYSLVPELRTSEGLAWYFGNYDVFDGMR